MSGTGEPYKKQTIEIRETKAGPRIRSWDVLGYEKSNAYPCADSPADIGLRKCGPAEAATRDVAGAANSLLGDANVPSVHLNEVLQQTAYGGAAYPDSVRALTFHFGQYRAGSFVANCHKHSEQGPMKWTKQLGPGRRATAFSTKSRTWAVSPVWTARNLAGDHLPTTNRVNGDAYVQRER